MLPACSTRVSFSLALGEIESLCREHEHAVVLGSVITVSSREHNMLRRWLPVWVRHTGY
jgi:hypothetical protein